MSYLDGHLTRGFLTLYLNRAVMYVGNGLFGIFLPLFIFQLFDGSIFAVAFYYTITSLAYAFFLPLSAELMDRFSMRKTLYVGIFFSIANLLVYAFAQSLTPYTTVLFAGLFLVLARLTYWVPYHTSFATLSDHNNRSREVAIMYTILNVTGIIAPLLAGLIITQFSYTVLFALGVIVYVLSIIPLFCLPTINEDFSWTYTQTWQKIMNKENRATVLALYADGVETAVGILVWPLFIFLLLDGDFLSVGAISAAITAATILLSLLAGRWSDKFSQKKVLRYGTTLYALGWVVKIFIVTATHIFVVDAFHRLVRAFTRSPFEAMVYDMAADEGHYVDEFTVLKEMLLHLGRATTYIAVIISSFVFPMQWTFLLAAIAAVTINMIRTKLIV